MLGFLVIFVPLIALYVYKKCPNIVKICGILCIISILSKITIFYSNVFTVTGLHWKILIEIFSASLSKNYVFKWMLLIQDHIVFLHVMFIVLCFIRLWWCDKLNMEMNSASVGLEHLETEAIRSGKSLNEGFGNYWHDKCINVLPPFPNGWFPLMESDELKNGETKIKFALGRYFTVIRDPNGHVYVFEAFGTYPENGLLDENKNMPQSCQKSFDNAQELEETDNLKSEGILMDKKIKNLKWICEEVNKEIFIWHHTDKIPPLWHIPTIPEINNGLMICKGKGKHVIRGHIQDTFENGADLNHFNAVHFESPFFEIKPKDFRRKPNIFTLTWKIGTWLPSVNENESFMASLEVEATLRIFNIPIDTTKTTFITYGPGYGHVKVESKYFETHLFEAGLPKSTLELNVIQSLYSTRFFPQYLANWILRMNFNLVCRDIVIWNNKKYIKNPYFIKEDKCIKDFRHWFSQFYSVNK